jgi:hypothetical protein
VTDLADYQFEILPSEDATDGFVFGIGAAVSLNDGGFDPGEDDGFNQDQDNSRRGVKAFGRDVAGAKTWVWESHTDQEDAASALDVLDDMSAAWKPYQAQEPGWTTAVRYRLAGRYRRVYGRPRRYSAPPSNLILNGMVPVTHDFQCVDSYTYDDVESSAVIPYASAAVGGGFTLPATFPITTQPSEGNGAQQITVGGNARAYPIVRFNGPWTNPVMDAGDWTLRWKGTVPAAGWVEIDTRPWKLTVLDQDGASVVGGLERQTWLEDCWFAPRSTPMMLLGGSAPTGDATATVRWRNTWTSI